MKNLFMALILFAVSTTSDKLLAQNSINPWYDLPLQIKNWTPAEEDRIFHEEDLFDYIDGGAELFLSFGFNQVFNRIYARPNQPDIYVDVFEMSTAYNAYGVFTLSTEEPAAEFGQGAQYTEGAILFWKDKYFVSIITSPETPEAKEAVFEIAEVIDKAIPNTGELPDVLNYLPQDNLEPASVRYFRHHHWQNSHLYLAYENIFNIDQTTHCALAKYNYDNEKVILLLIDYTDEETAANGQNKFIKNFIPELNGKTSVKVKDDSYTGAKLFGNLLAVVVKAKSRNDVSVLLDLVKSKLLP